MLTLETSVGGNPLHSNSKFWW